jgi:hypothetical protein
LNTDISFPNHGSFSSEVKKNGSLPFCVGNKDKKMGGARTGRGRKP